MNKDEKSTTMAWTTPSLVEICIGLEINCCRPRMIGHGQGFPRAAMNSRGER
jgi:coenzyme PQQ precursor peptide PqqA